MNTSGTLRRSCGAMGGAIDYLVMVPRFPVPGEKLRMSAFAREGGGQVAAGLSCRGMGGRAAIPTIEAIRAAGASPNR